ncbi:MAG: HAD family phosphatase [Acidimicrobiales bacterium]
MSAGRAERRSGPPSPPAAVLFDLDGTLVDREPLMLESLRRAAADAGAPLAADEAADYLGRAWQDVYAGLAIGDRTGLGFASFLDRVVAWSERLVADGHPVRVLPGGPALIERLGAAGVAVGVVTGSLRREATAALGLVGVLGRLDVFVPADDYERGKPAPDAYLLAAARLGVEPAAAWWWRTRCRASPPGWLRACGSSRRRRPTQRRATRRTRTCGPPTSCWRASTTRVRGPRWAVPERPRRWAGGRSPPAPSGQRGGAVRCTTYHSPRHEIIDDTTKLFCWPFTE